MTVERCWFDQASHAADEPAVERGRVHERRPCCVANAVTCSAGMRRPSWLLVVIGVAASLLAGCGGAGFTRSHPTSDRWVEIETPHFVIDTDLVEPRALWMARALEDARAALLASAWPDAQAPRGKTRVMLFARQRDLSRYAGRNNKGAVFTRPGFERLLAFTPGVFSDVSTVAVHELAHDLSRWFLPLQPLWLAEGLALYLEGIQIDPARGQAQTGSVSKEVVEWLSDEASPIPSTTELFAALGSDSVDPRDSASFYLGSWALVHYLLDEQPQAFRHFQKALARLTPWRTAWGQSFPGLTNAELDRQLIRYLKAGRFIPRKSDFERPVFTPDVRALSPAEVYGARALLANTSGQTIGGAELRAALDLDPNALDALTVSFHSLASHARAPRTDIARRAVKAHPRHAAAWLLAALAASDVGERRRALTQAQRLDPDHPGVVGLLAEDALARNDPLSALIHVRHAQRRSGVTPRNLALQFAALAASNPCDEAAATLEGAALSLEAPSLGTPSPEGLWFEPECRVVPGPGQREVTCSDDVRRAYAARSSCSSKAL